MLLILLVEPRLLPIPHDVSVIKNFGSECIATFAGGTVERTITADSMYLEGEPEAFVRWLAPHGGVFTTTSPGLGDWSIHHVRADVAKAVEEGKVIPLAVKPKEVVREPTPVKEPVSFASGPRRLWAKLFATRKTESL